MLSPIKFTTNDLQDIITPLTNFVSALYTCAEILPQINETLIKKTPTSFRVRVNDGIKRKDRKFNPKHDFVGGIDYSNTLIFNALKAGEDLESIKNNLCSTIQSGGYIYGDYKDFFLEFFPNPNQKAKNCRVFVADNLIIESNIKSSETIVDFIRTHPKCAKEMIRKTALATIFAKQNPHCSQKEMDTFLLNHEKEVLRKTALTLPHIPFMQAVENLRQMLFNILIKNHANQIATDMPTARETLKKNKDNIYTWAETLGYIPNATPFIKYQNIRDKLAHPNEFNDCGSSALSNHVSQIVMDFEQLLTHMTHGKNLNFHVIESQNIPSSPIVSEPVRIDADDISAYALVKNLDALENLFKDYTLPKKQNGKPVSGRKKLEALATLGVIAQQDITTLENAITTRNKYAHGNTDTNTGTMAEISRIASSNLLDIVQNHHQNHIGYL